MKNFIFYVRIRQNFQSQGNLEVTQKMHMLSHVHLIIEILTCDMFNNSLCVHEYRYNF